MSGFFLITTVKPGFRLVEINEAMSHGMHNRMISFPQVDTNAARFDLAHDHVILCALEFPPDVGPQRLLHFPMNRDDIQAHVGQRLGDTIIIWPEGGKNHHRLGKSVDHRFEASKLCITDVMDLLLVVINEARRDLSSLHDVCHLELGDSALAGVQANN